MIHEVFDVDAETVHETLEEKSDESVEQMKEDYHQFVEGDLEKYGKYCACKDLFYYKNYFIGLKPLKKTVSKNNNICHFPQHGCFFE